MVLIKKTLAFYLGLIKIRWIRLSKMCEIAIRVPTTYANPGRSCCNMPGIMPTNGSTEQWEWSRKAHARTYARTQERAHARMRVRTHARLHTHTHLDGAVSISDCELFCVKWELHWVNSSVSVMNADFLLHHVFGEIILQLDSCNV